MNHPIRPFARAAAPLLLALCGAIATGPAAAQSLPSSPLSRCLADNTTGKERKLLARWLFVAMGAHPEMRHLAQITPEQVEGVSREAGLLFTRLLAETCAREAAESSRANGAMAVQTGFATLGQLAMQELMTDPQVMTTMSALQRHLDLPRIEAVLRPKGN